ncbi:MAG: pyridoxamine 5'-phosphate oxidase family protein [Gammaproteobacteria bacterium]|nr:pyridoxamine 5'-phosphate oxidase family protein [Gammaproteobacteria bacterium]
MNSDSPAEIIQAARQLLSGRFQGVLSTHSQEHNGYPFGSLVPYSIDRNGWPLLLLSHLAKHTGNLRADRRCSLTVVEQGNGDTQQLTRLICLADAYPVDPVTDALQKRHFRYFPESRIYYQELGFHFFGLRPVRFYCVSGFGAARWIDIDRMTINRFTLSQEDELLAPINRHVSENVPKGGTSQTVAIGVDPWGLDLLRGERLYRFEFPEVPVSLEDIPQAVEHCLANRQIP